MIEEQAQILIVEDEMNSLKVLMNHFREQSFEILYAKDGEEVCEIVNEEPPDLILMDWAMPIMNGIQATLKLKAKRKTANIPIMMITGVMTTVEDLKEALSAGAARETATVETNLHRLKRKIFLDRDERIKEKIRSF